MIRRFRASRLNGKISCDLNFSEDINVITGRNGSGKTTVLKAIWYLMSANIERIPAEMTFDSLELETDNFLISIMRLPNPPDIQYTRDKFLLRLRADGVEHDDEVELASIEREDVPVRRANETTGPLSGSIFFPTFRRIEGGFSMVNPESRRRTRSQSGQITVSSHVGPTSSYGMDTIQSGFAGLSGRLSLFDHTFVASISTDDIVRLLTEKYASISETTNRQHRDLSEEIIKKTTKYTESKKGAESSQLRLAQQILQEISEKVLEFKSWSDIALRPFTTLSELVSEIFRTQGIRITENIVLGDLKNSINSGMLSSGEKQMRSFLSYNALSEKKSIFIDEPEISLHVDWQRILFPTLLRQDTKNQFIIATHSPFIYTKYADKELILNVDRGDSDILSPTGR